jgi:hypothetical protein
LHLSNARAIAVHPRDRRPAGRHRANGRAREAVEDWTGENNAPFSGDRWLRCALARGLGRPGPGTFFPSSSIATPAPEIALVLSQMFPSAE